MGSEVARRLKYLERRYITWFYPHPKRYWKSNNPFDRFLSSTPSGNTLSAAEHTCAMMLALSR